MKNILRLLIVVLVTSIPTSIIAQSNREYYEIRFYHFNMPEQEKSIDEFLEKALLPALKRQGINETGVFKPVINDTAANKKVVVLIPFKNSKKVLQLEDALESDKTFQEAGKNFLAAAYNSPDFLRVETVLLQSFQGMPVHSSPGKSADRIYELRSYESATDALYRNKVEMFNSAEVKLFNRLDFGAVFYGEVLYGCRMPNLMYMTSFQNMEERDRHWKTFSDDPEWKQLVSMEKYRNNMSKMDLYLMKATAYSTL